MKYTTENIEAFLTAIRHGMSIKNTCELVGINQDTYFTWMKEHPEFSDKVKRARGERTLEALKVIRGAAIKSWQAAAWFLERTFPDQYGLKTQVTNVTPPEEEAARKDRAKRLTRRLNEIVEEQVKGSSSLLNTRAPAPAGVDNFDAKSTEKDTNVVDRDVPPDTDIVI